MNKIWKTFRDDLTTFIIIGLFLLTIAYGVTLIYLSTKNCFVPDALTYSWFGLVTGECGIAGLLRCNKRKHENSDCDTDYQDGVNINGCNDAYNSNVIVSDCQDDVEDVENNINEDSCTDNNIDNIINKFNKKNESIKEYNDVY